LKVYNGTSWVNFDADTVDGFHASQTPTANTIPVAGSTGKLDAGWLPAVGNLNMVEFTISGNWAVPSGVTKIMVFAIAGGGGGGGSGTNATNGGNGGNTIIYGSASGTILTLTGGGGGSGSNAATVGPGVSYSGVAGYAIDASNNYSGFGAGSPFGGGGRSVKNTGNGEAGNGYGSGGSGAGFYGGGGGSGQCVLGAVYSVTSGETLTITIGAGGSGGSGAYTGGGGRPGFVRIIYFA
jgi:hypothetical protein